MQRTILIIIGWLAVVLGHWAWFCPVADYAVHFTGGTVFRPLVAAFPCWLLYRSWFGGYLRHWQRYRAMPPGAKPRAIALILLTFGISLWLVNMMWVRVLLLVILACLLIFMWRIPVIDEKQQKR